MPRVRPFDLEERRKIDMKKKASQELAYLVGVFTTRMAFTRVTKQELADFLGISRNAVGRKFAHPDTFTGEEISMIKQYLEITTSYSA